MFSLLEIHPYWLIGLSLALAMLPVAAALLTSYLKISIVLGTLRSGLGAQNVPGPIVVMGLSLCASAIVMAPVCAEMAQKLGGLDPAALRSAPRAAALAQAREVFAPLREFMLRNCGSRELASVRRMSAERSAVTAPQEQGEGEGEAGFGVVAAAFILSELRRSFSMAFVLLLPFLVIDLAVATVLAGLGMYMVSPVMVALPLKLLLFAASDGWLLLTDGLVRSYAV